MIVYPEDASTDPSVVMRSQAQWTRPRDVQEQVNRRIAEIGSRVEPLNVKIADFLAHYSKEEIVAITLGLAPVETECHRMWAIVIHQEGRRMVLAGREAAEKTKEQAALAGLVAALTWEHTKERVADPVQWAPRMIVYPEEAERVMERVRDRKWHTLPPELELIGQQIACLREGWARNVYLNMLDYEEARKQDPRVDSWMLLADNAALSAHRFICEDGPDLPKEEDQEAADEGGEVPEGMYAAGCESLEQARIQANVGAGIGTEPVGECEDGLGRGIGIQSAQERIPTPVPSDEDEEEMTYDQARLLRKFLKGGRPSTGLEVGVTNLEALKW
jgi:hypothetical protein